MRQAKTATFAEGDWNGDGAFDQLDVVAALATGSYLQQPNPAKKPKTDVVYDLKMDMDGFIPDSAPLVTDEGWGDSIN